MQVGQYLLDDPRATGRLEYGDVQRGIYPSLNQT